MTYGSKIVAVGVIAMSFFVSVALGPHVIPWLLALPEWLLTKATIDELLIVGVVAALLVVMVGMIIDVMEM